MSASGKSLEVMSPETTALEITLSPRKPKAIEGVLTKEEFARMWRAAQDAKDRCILALGLLGLRASEMADVTSDWVDFAQGTITIPRGKGRKPRTVSFEYIDLVKGMVQAYFHLHDRLGLTRQAIWSRVRRMARSAGIAKRVTPHSLRATAATWYAQAGFSAQALREHFGWDHLGTAQKYIEQSGATALREMREKGTRIF